MAVQVDMASQFNLDLLPHNEQGVTLYYVHAHIWWRKPADQDWPV